MNEPMAFPKEPSRDLTQFVNLQTVREALDNLYSPVGLAKSTLATCGLFVEPDGAVLQKAQLLRNLLLDAVETLRPRYVPSSQAQPAARAYEVLSLRYVVGYSVQEISEQLNIGTRQIYRDLRQAEDEIEQELLSRLCPAQTGKPLHAYAVLQEEIDALEATSYAVDLTNAMQGALEIVQPLADRQQVSLTYHKTPYAVWANLAPGVAKELLIQLLSAAIQQCETGERLSLEVSGKETSVEIRLHSAVRPFSVRHIRLHHALTTARSLGMTVHEDGDEAHELAIAVDFMRLQLVLIVEDNPGVQALYERYLQGSQWRVVPIADSQQVEQIAAELHPAAIILDILMSNVDGWSILQRLKADLRLADVPVIICSVVDDRELAHALGAAAYLKKPLTRLELIGALERTARLHNTA